MTAIASKRTRLRPAPGLIDLPVPPLSLPTGENAYRVGEAVLVTLGEGERLKGALLAFRTERRHLLMRLDSQTGGDAEEISFKNLRTAHLLRDRKVVRLSPTLEVRGQVVMPPTRQEFEVVLTDDETLRGHTLGFRIDQHGLHLYPAHESGVYTHLFVSAHAIKTQRVGPLLGQALVEEELVTYDALAAELTAQHKLRELPIGEYLKSEHLVTAQQLEAALERQRAMPHVRVGEILIRDGVITKVQLAAALHYQEKNRKMPLGEMLVSAGLVSTATVTRTLAKKLGVPFIDLHDFAVDVAAVKLVSAEIAREYQVMPLYIHDGRMVVAIENPMQWQILEALRGCVKMDVEAVMATPADIALTINKYYGDPQANSIEEDLTL